MSPVRRRDAVEPDPKEILMAEESTDTLAVIAAITAEEAGVEASAVSRESRFADDLDIDSLGLLTIATQVEERFGVALDDSTIPTLTTVGALVDLVIEQKV
jgi:acyl carrier protein